MPGSAMDLLATLRGMLWKGPPLFSAAHCDSAREPKEPLSWDVQDEQCHYQHRGSPSAARAFPDHRGSALLLPAGVRVPLQLQPLPLLAWSTRRAQAGCGCPAASSFGVPSLLLHSPLSSLLLRALSSPRCLERSFWRSAHLPCAPPGLSDKEVWNKRPLRDKWE